MGKSLRLVGLEWPAHLMEVCCYPCLRAINLMDPSCSDSWNLSFSNSRDLADDIPGLNAALLSGHLPEQPELDCLFQFLGLLVIELLPTCFHTVSSEVGLGV